jgi:hypothetical protein
MEFCKIDPWPFRMGVLEWLPEEKPEVDENCDWPSTGPIGDP